MKTLFFILALYLVYVVIKSYVLKKNLEQRRAGRPGPPPTKGTAGAGGAGEAGGVGEEMVQDPVCKSYVPLSSAITLTTPGGRVYFCSNECRDKYEAVGGGA